MCSRLESEASLLKELIPIIPYQTNINQKPNQAKLMSWPSYRHYI